MTTVSINRSGTDQATLDIFQVGNHESSVYLRHDLLDSKLNYHFAVTSLSVPLNDTPIFKLSGPTELFRIERRDVGASINSDLTMHEPGNPAGAAPTTGIFQIRPDDKMFDASTFVKSLSNFVRGSTSNGRWLVSLAEPLEVGTAKTVQIIQPKTKQMRTQSRMNSWVSN